MARQCGPSLILAFALGIAFIAAGVLTTRSAFSAEV
jgi:hypothetical protein